MYISNVLVRLILLVPYYNITHLSGSAEGSGCLCNPDVGPPGDVAVSADVCDGGGGGCYAGDDVHHGEVVNGAVEDITWTWLKLAERLWLGKRRRDHIRWICW